MSDQYSKLTASIHKDNIEYTLTTPSDDGNSVVYSIDRANLSELSKILTNTDSSEAELGIFTSATGLVWFSRVYCYHYRGCVWNSNTLKAYVDFSLTADVHTKPSKDYTIKDILNAVIQRAILVRNTLSDLEKHVVSELRKDTPKEDLIEDNSIYIPFIV
jgi:hypothetical protein